MGTVSVTLDTQVKQNIGQRYWVHGTMAFSNSYATGGDTFSLTQLGFGSTIDAFVATSTASPTNTATGYAVSWRSGPGSTQAVQAYGSGATNGATLNEVTNATNLSTYVFRFMAIGV